jgi:zinc transporter ZupT
MLSRTLLVVALVRGTNAQHDHGHNHGGGGGGSAGGFEWSGVFATSGASHQWSMQQVGGAYADPAMKIVLIPTDSPVRAALAHDMAAATTLGAGTCPEVEAGGTMTIASAGSCYEMHVGTAADSLYTIDTNGISGLVIYTAHMPTEFERDMHYLKDASGADVEPVAQLAPPIGQPEWGGSFSLSGTTHQWSMQAVGSPAAYADPAMKIVLIPNPSGTDADSMRAMEMPTMLNLYTGTCPEIEAGESMTVASSGSCFEMHVGTTDDSLFTINTASGVSSVAIFTAHVPIEFERTQHYLKDSAGTDIEPIEQYTPGSPGKRWGAAIGAAFAVNVITFTGIVLLVPGVKQMLEKNPNVFYAFSNAFAAGALLAAAFYLMLLEGSHYFSGAESEVAFLWGTMVLCGVITASVIDLIVSAIAPAEKPVTPATKTDVESATTEDGVAAIGHRSRILSGVIVGDFMHNLCDGIFIGTAFTACTDALAWNITIATILHEIAQEFADYVVLTDPKQVRPHSVQL